MEITNIEMKSECYKNSVSNQWRIILLQSGSAQLQVDSVETKLETGSLCILPPEKGYSLIPDLSGKYYELMLRDFRPFGEVRVFLLHDDAEQSLNDICRLILRYWSKRELTINYAVINSLGDAFYHGLAGIYAKNETHDFRIERVVDIMYMNIPNRNFNLQECLAGSGYSVGHFRRLFKGMTGYSPSQYMNRIRIEHAKSQIHQFGKSKSIKEIAMESGFEDSLYFSRVFHNIEGKSPMEYKAMVSIIEKTNAISVLLDDNNG